MKPKYRSSLGKDLKGSSTSYPVRHDRSSKSSIDFSIKRVEIFMSFSFLPFIHHSSEWTYLCIFINISGDCDTGLGTTDLECECTMPTLQFSVAVCCKDLVCQVKVWHYLRKVVFEVLIPIVISDSIFIDYKLSMKIHLL